MYIVWEFFEGSNFLETFENRLSDSLYFNKKNTFPYYNSIGLPPAPAPLTPLTAKAVYEVSNSWYD